MSNLEELIRKLKKMRRPLVNVPRKAVLSLAEENSYLKKKIEELEKDVIRAGMIAIEPLTSPKVRGYSKSVASKGIVTWTDTDSSW